MTTEPRTHSPAQLASALLTLLQPHTKEATIAGSIRRGRPDPHDIEIVLIPGDDLFDFHLAGLRLRPDPSHLRDGPRYKRRLYDGFPIDLFIVLPPADWGLTLAIRTGSAEFSQALLARWKRVSGGGFSQGGRLYTPTGRHHPTPSEDDVFEACGLRWYEPNERDAARAATIAGLKGR